MRRLGWPQGLRRAAAATVVLVASAWSGTALAARLALLIGNDTYQTVSRLKNPAADVRLIEGKLRQIGFDVDVVTNATKTVLGRSLRDFGRKVLASGPGAEVMIYYAGHGIQDKGANYLIPVDADLQVQGDVVTEALNLDIVVKMLEHPNVRTGIVVLDACRDNPLPAGTRSAKRGLALEERTGLYIAFSTEPNNVALDGEGANSPYAEALAAEITTPGVEIEKVFKNVRTRVFDATNGKQRPWESSRLMQEVFLAGRPLKPAVDTGTDAAITPLEGGAPTPAPVFALADPNIEFAKAVQADTAEAYEKLLQQFPSHPRRDFIIASVQRKAEEGLWKESDTARGRPEEGIILDRLITAFPSGIYGDRARERKAAIEAEVEAKRRAAQPRPELSALAQSEFGKAERVNTVEAWSSFLAAYPYGSLSNLARYNLAVLTSQQAPPPTPIQRSEPAPTRQATQYHYVTGLDPNGNNWLALRNAPSFSAPWSATRMSPGTLLTVRGKMGEWMNVELLSGETGWSSGRFIACCVSADAAPRQVQPARTEPVARPAGGGQYHFVSGLDPNGNNWLALRNAPSFSAPWSATRMGPGTLLKVQARQGEWYQVQLLSGETGWASSKYVVCCRAN